ncbi:phosphotriesterase family protein [Rhizobium leguminosarum]|uniref:phosphotriesterase family protein n=1 Tax=Rhizobium leguminosarum TaxID=384 RepID=UPI001440FEB6|nr:esterase [Rhizobium leguminosarum]NKK67755.1 esterase [Rhizobium leguminosarum bv. viciae]NKL09083.1 esterase [Rhizobium leguminosarum bv. viciae]NKL84814.1 esterase [Rhizobium leguminosarum bv. viciae]NKL94710.1 esterase [Rhizobium leguminosarum bv. viciae]NKM94961.1 esterase [Rhizobium leguminosarum bv. viciae]
MKHLRTTLGPKSKSELGMILPHEHVFVDLRTPDQPGYAEAEIEDVVRLMAPEIERIKKLGVTALVECSTGGVGRRADIDLAVSLATDFPIVVPTGNYREPWIPEWVRHASEKELEAWMLRELTEQIDETGFQAGWIKLSAGDDGMTALETKILRAAARAAAQTDAVIGSHTIRGRVVMDQLDVIEAEGYRADRFISIHTQEEKDFAYNVAVAERGAWIEYDHVGRGEDNEVAELVIKALEAGCGDRLLLSHDRGWFDPALPMGGIPKPYTHLSTVLLPELKRRGIEDGTLVRLTHDNPFEAFAR